MSNSRTYLSIGDVLTLLREEFPDVTISKIRFLESQGLVNPERSPSGYRKFFEHDVERLRWVLRQQREHFLPLKVIRDRLAEGNLDDIPADVPGETTSASQNNGRPSEPAHVGAAASGGNGIKAGLGKHSIGGTGTGEGVVEVAGSTDAGPREAQLTKADTEAMARILADASRRTARRPEGDPDAVPAAGTEARSTTAAAAARPPAVPGATTAPAPRPPSAPLGTSVAAQRAANAAKASPQSGGDAMGKGVDVVAEAVASVSKGAPAGAGAAARRAAGGAAGTAPGSPSRPPGSTAGRTTSARAAPPAAAATASAGKSSTSSMVTGASMTADELCSASGLSEIELASLQGFGLIEAMEVAGIQTFDEDALTVANLAAELRVFGIEPRHLRLYRNAVDREVGLIEQVIIPLLRQRNPESRQRAIESAEQLGALGQTMRATLLRSALRRHLGG